MSFEFGFRDKNTGEKKRKREEENLEVEKGETETEAGKSGEGEIHDSEMKEVEEKEGKQEIEDPNEMEDVGGKEEEEEKEEEKKEEAKEEEKEKNEEALSSFPFQLQVQYVRLDGTKLVRVVTHFQETTQDRQEAERDIDVDALCFHAAQVLFDLLFDLLLFCSFVSVVNYCFFGRSFFFPNFLCKKARSKNCNGWELRRSKTPYNGLSETS